MDNSISSVQSLSHVRLFVTPWTAARQASLSITNSWSSPKLMSIESVMPSNHFILCRSLLLLPSISQHQGLSNESVLRIRWSKYWEFQLQHQSFQWLFRTDFQGFMKSWFSTKPMDQHTVHPKTLSSIRICSELQAHLSSPRKRSYSTQCLPKQVISFFRPASPGLLLVVKGITNVSLSNLLPGPHSPLTSHISSIHKSC